MAVTIDTDLVSGTVIQGNSFTFQVSASTDDPTYLPLTYSWWHIVDEATSSSLAETSSILTLSAASVTSSAAGAYSVFVADAEPSNASSSLVTLTVQPGVSTQPSLGGVNVLTQWQSANLTVAGSSDTSITYQWVKNGSNIAGATSATLTLARVQPKDNGTYYCMSHEKDISSGIQFFQ